MTKAHSISDLESRPFDKLSIKFLKMFKGWPVSIVHENIPKNADVPFVLHRKTEEFVYIIEGKAKAFLGNRNFDVRSGDYLLIPPGVKHRFVTGQKPLVALSVFCPPMPYNKLDAIMCKDIKRKKTKNIKKDLCVEN